MAGESMCSNNNNNYRSPGAQVRQELLNALLEAEGVTQRDSDEDPLGVIEVAEEPDSRISYPWKPADPGAEEFFEDLEQPFSLDDWDGEAVSSRAQIFFGQLDTLWNTLPIRVSLSQRFAALVPQEVLETIVHKAQEVVSASLSVRDKLVQCVQEVQLSLEEDVLFTLARPYAGALRDATEPELPRESWESLSEVQRAKLAMAIAHQALGHLQPQQPE